MNKRLKLVSILCLLFFTTLSFAQKRITENNVFNKNIRRHFLIAVDISGPFKSKLRSTPELKNSLISLFQNNIPHSTINENTSNLKSETQNGNYFFDPNLDEISYFQFGVTQREKEILKLDKHEYDTMYIVNHFVDKFIENKNFNWSSFQENSSEVSLYINSIYNQIPETNFGDGVTISNYVYPLVMDKIDSDRYANEYILIIISDFLTGSQFGNKEDFLRLKDIYCYSYDETAPSDAPPELIKNYINDLSNAFYPVNYFEYAFNSNGNNIGILAYKILPKAGKSRPEDISMFIDGNIELEQLKYKGEIFNLSETQLRFTHNNTVNIDDMLLSVKVTSDIKSNIPFNFTIAKKENDKWYSDFTTSSKFMDYDSTSMTYYLPALKKLSLKSSYLGNVGLTYIANVSYQPLKNVNKSINYAFQTVRNIKEKDVEYKSKLTKIIMVYLLPTIAVLLLIVIFILLARPKAIKLKLATKLNDSFEEINYQKKLEDKNVGRYILPYLRWDKEKTNQTFIIEGDITQGNRLFRALWRDSITVKLVKEKSLSSFEIYLKDSNGNLSGAEDDLKLSVSNKGLFEFFIDVEKADSQYNIDKHNKFKFEIEAYYQRSFLLFSKKLKGKINYSFFVGPDLGNVWVGIDPGTTGTCIATGADGISDIFIPKDDKGKDLIIPSIITFLKDATNNEMQEALSFKDKKCYYGKVGENQRYAVKYGAESFRSVKKMLGFKNEKQIKFTKEPIVTYNVKGKEFCNLLCQGAYNDLKTELLKEQKKEYLDGKIYNPQRAIVAIPNNFIANKIQDITDSLRMMEQFQEIRCIYEAEANLMYYLFGIKEITENATVLLFDIGGATINATVVSIEEEEIKDGKFYNIDILGKLGYGIGGDTIDYIILKYLDKYLNPFGIYIDPSKLNGDKQLKERLVDLAFRIKLEIIENFEKNNDLLIDNIKLAHNINEAYGSSISFDEDDDIMTAFKRKNKKYPFFEEELIQNLLYKNIEAVTKDIMELSGEEIDHVIFSGRSVVFPLIQTTVMKTLKQEIKPKIHALEIDKLKSSIAIGACLYGMNKSRIKLNTAKVNSSFGVKRKTGANEFEFIKLIDIGTPFRRNGEDLRKLTNRVDVESDFGFEGGMVNFYQIMGSNPIEVFKNEEKHKYSLIKQKRPDTSTQGVGIEVWENDEIICEIKEKGAKEIKKYSAEINEVEVNEANEEHYTWIIQ